MSLISQGIKTALKAGGDAAAEVAEKVGKGLASEPETAALVKTGREATEAPGMAPMAPAEAGAGVMRAAAGELPTPAPHRTPMRSVNLDRVETSEEADQLLDFVSQYTDNAGKRTVSFEEQGAIAEDLGMDEEILAHLSGRKKLPPAEQRLLTAPQMRRARDLMITSTNQLIERAQDIAVRTRSGDVGHAELFDFQRQIYRHMSLQSAVQNEGTELARALGYMRETAQPLNADQLSDLMSQSGAGKTIAMKAQFIADAGQGLEGAELLKATSKAIRDVGGTTIPRAIIGYRTLQLLSSPVTHTRNMLGNTIVALMAPLERIPAGAVGSLRGGKDRAYVGEAYQMYAAYASSFMDALKMAGTAWKTQQSSFGAAKIDELNSGPPQELIERLQWIPKPMRQGLDYLGQIVSWPGRALTSEDEFFKVIAFRGELRALAYRQAKNEGLKGDALVARMQELQTAPTQEKIIERLQAEGFEGDELGMAADVQMGAEMNAFRGLYQQADNFAHYQTFTDPLEASLAKLAHSSAQHPAVKFILPFTKTPMNLLSYAAERSPLGVITPQTWRNIKAGGAARDMAISRVAVGTAVTGALSMYAAAGNITGAGPDNAALRASWMAGGWRPYSIRIGDTWVSYRGLEPVTSVIGMLGNVYDAIGHAPSEAAGMELGALAALGMAESISDATFMQGLAEFFAAIENAENSRGEGYAARGLVSFLPQNALLRNLAQRMDEVQRNPESEEVWERINNEVKRIVPGMSKTVPPRVDALGNVARYDESFGWDFVSPIRYLSTRNGNAEQQNVQDHINVNSAALSRPRWRLTDPETRIGIDIRELVPTDPKGFKFEGEYYKGKGWVWFDFQQMVGQERMIMLDQTINTAEYENAPWGEPDDDPTYETKGDILVRVADAAKVKARNDFMEKYRTEIDDFIIATGGISPKGTPPPPKFNVDELEKRGLIPDTGAKF